MKILITGWNGINDSFIPQELANHLQSKNHEVMGYDWDENWDIRSETIYAWKWDDASNQYVHAKPNNSNVSEEPLENFDLVIHLGAISSTTEIDVEQIMKQNFDFSVWLLQKCNQHKIPLHYASSASVYGQTTHFNESGNMQPQTPYSYSKCMFDRIVKQNIDQLSIPIIGFRYFNVYSGNAEEHKKNQSSPVYRWNKDIQTKNEIILFEGSDEALRDFIWVKDVCEIHEKLLTSDYKGILNIGTGEAVSFEYIANKYKEKTGCNIKYQKFPENLKCHYQKYTCADTSTLLSLIDHKFTTIDEYFDMQYKMV